MANLVQFTIFSWFWVTLCNGNVFETAGVIFLKDLELGAPPEVPAPAEVDYGAKETPTLLPGSSVSSDCLALPPNVTSPSSPFNTCRILQSLHF